MIIGSGLLATAFRPFYRNRPDVCVYAAGVSNSGCTNPDEYAREKDRLDASLALAKDKNVFVYFSTCSIADDEIRSTPYVLHKLAMEERVRTHPQHLIVRLPQVAGRTPNPHTLLNYLYARISRSESFCLWHNARRNILDVEDVARITDQLIANPAIRAITLNVANEKSYSMMEIVSAMEKAVGKHAIYERSDARGKSDPYLSIDISPILGVLDAARVHFGDNYLQEVIDKYYGQGLAR